MADDEESGRAGGEGVQAAGSHEPRECMACRGSGRVISNLGGSASEVTCPWCEGSGRRTPDIDAQARWRSEDTDGGEAAEPGGEPVPSQAPEPAPSQAAEPAA